MKNLMLMTSMALSFAMPAFSDSRGNQGNGRGGGPGQDRGGSFGQDRDHGRGQGQVQDRGQGHGRQDHEGHGQPAVRYSAPRGGRGGYGIAATPAYPVAPYVSGGARSGSYSNDPYYSTYSNGYPNDAYAQDNGYYQQDPYAQDPGDGYVGYAPYAPPPPPQEVYGSPAGPGYVWVSGYWRWGGAQFSWSPGQWMRPPSARASWNSGGWFQVNGRFGFRRGYWR